MCELCVVCQLAERRTGGGGGGEEGGEGPFKIKVTCKNVNRLVEATRERCYLLLALLLGGAVYDNDCYICGPQFQRNM